MSDSDGGFSAGKVADAIREGDVDALYEAFLADDEDAADLLLRLERAYDEDGDGPDDVRDTPLWRILARPTTTESLRHARQDGDVDTLSASTGITDGSIEASGYEMLVDACKPAAHQILLKGPKGSGKTTKALDIIKRLYNAGEIDKVLTNVRGPEEHEAVEFAEDISRYLEFAKEPGEKLALFDEFSTVGNAYTGQKDVEQVMSRVINAFRKSEGGSLRTMYIGHENENDIHPLVKKQSDVVIQADGKVDEGLIDSATVYRGWQDYTRDDHWFRVSGLRDIPDASPWSFSTNYFAHLEWDLDAPEKQIQRGQLIDGWEQFQDDETGDESDELPLRKCRGHNRRGESCGQRTRHESGYCDAHRDEWDGDPDPRLEDGDGGEEDVTNDEDEVEELVADAIASNADELVEGDHLAAIRQTLSAAQAVSDDDHEAEEDDVALLAGTLASQYDLAEDEAREMAEEMVED